jgi:hypothetical protein
MTAELAGMFTAAAQPFESEYRLFHARDQAGGIDPDAEAQRLSELYECTAAWIENCGEMFNTDSDPAFMHTDRFFVEKILRELASQHRSRAAELRTVCSDHQRISHEYRRLAALFRVEITVFERKLYANLSHQANKAMNLNSYIGLLGRSFREIKAGDGTHLVECPPEVATLAIPAADFLLTLDADSFVLPEYALRLVAVMQADPRVAVAQTPYSAVTDPPRLLERVAGATTDIQYLVHQGFTRFDATYWVGANALLRVAALSEINTVVEERGYRVPVFIQDRTVIEDTGSTVDLIRRGWRLHNCPERLAYSATPPDFGALVIQRRRWSNGGLIIMPDLVRYWRSEGRHPTLTGFAQALMRAHYLCSPAVGTFGVLAILLYRWNPGLESPWLPLTAGRRTADST